MNYVEYYDRFELLKKDNSFNNIYTFDEICMGGLALFHLFAAFGCISLVLSQISATISEITFYEKTKNHNLESHYCLISIDNKKSEVTIKF